MVVTDSLNCSVAGMPILYLLFVVLSKGSWKHDFTCPNIYGMMMDGLETYAITIA